MRKFQTRSFNKTQRIIETLDLRQRNSIIELMLISRQREWAHRRHDRSPSKKSEGVEANFRSLVFQKPSHSGCSIINCVLLQLYTVYILLYTGAVQLWDILLGFIWPRSSIWSYVSKGQLISEWNFGVFKSSKKWTFLTDFCPSL